MLRKASANTMHAEGNVMGNKARQHFGATTNKNRKGLTIDTGGGADSNAAKRLIPLPVSFSMSSPRKELC